VLFVAAVSRRALRTTFVRGARLAGLGEKTRVAPFSWLQAWTQQDVPIPETYEQAASVGEGAPRLAPAA